MRNSTIITPDKNIVTLNPKPKFDIKIGASQGKVAILFSEPQSIITFTPREALDCASLLIKHASTLVEPIPIPIEDSGGNGEGPQSHSPIAE